ncbi:MAG: hypothetical protein WC806_02860 [Candidatus Gracilibacteria bacterium]|jgi:hypothetical protein
MGLDDNSKDGDEDGLPPPPTADELSAMMNRFPNDKYPTKEELEMESPESDDWFRSKGPIFTAQYLAYKDNQTTGKVDTITIGNSLIRIFGLPAYKDEYSIIILNALI